MLYDRKSLGNWSAIGRQQQLSLFILLLGSHINFYKQTKRNKEKKKQEEDNNNSSWAGDADTMQAMENLLPFDFTWIYVGLCMCIGFGFGLPVVLSNPFAVLSICGETNWLSVHISLLESSVLFTSNLLNYFFIPSSCVFLSDKWSQFWQLSEICSEKNSCVRPCALKCVFPFNSFLCRYTNI